MNQKSQIKFLNKYDWLHDATHNHNHVHDEDVYVDRPLLGRSGFPAFFSSISPISGNFSQLGSMPLKWRQ